MSSIPVTALEDARAAGNAASCPAPAAGLPFRIRPDLIVKRQPNHQGSVWIIHDPIALTYFHFGPNEWFILQQLDGERGWEEIRERFQQAHSPQQISIRELQVFLQRVWADGLLLGTRIGGIGKQLQQAAESLRRRTRFAKLTQWLAVRLPGFRPGLGLQLCVPFGRVFFHPLTLGIVVAVAIGTLLVALAKADLIATRLPTLGEYFRGEQLLLLGLALAIVKILHELGHAVACEVQGGHCHEMGVMLLCFVPCLYCDVSDSWLFPERWRRIAVAGAGMFVELCLAVSCFWVWLLTTDGTLNAMALNIVLVASLGTLLANGNPLLKYDGYFIASDLVGIPNLADSARRELARWMHRFFFWPAKGERPPTPHRGLAAYAAAAWIYRILVLIAIVWTVHQFLQPAGMGILAAPLVGMILLGMVMPIWQRGGLGRSPRGPWSSLRWMRLAFLLALMGGLVFVVGWVPMSFRIRAPLSVELARPQLVYAATAGRLIWSVPTETRVEPGDLIARLENVELTKQRDALARRLRVARVNLSNLQRQVAAADTLLEIHLLEAQVDDWGLQLRIVEGELAKCEIRAPSAGVVFSARRDPPLTEESDRYLAVWHGALLDPDNRGCFVEKGTAIAQLGTSGLQGVALVGQDQIERIQPGATAEVWLDQATPGILPGNVREISREPVSELPPHLAAQGWWPTRTDAAGRLVPQQSTYRVVLELERWPEVAIGSSGVVRIHADDETWGEYLLRFLRAQFRWPS